jgi:hypothetical protein
MKNLILRNHFLVFSGHYLDLLDNLFDHSISVVTHGCTSVVFLMGFKDTPEVHQ